MLVFDSLQLLDKMARLMVKDYIAEYDIRPRDVFTQAGILSAEDDFRNMLNGSGIVEGLVKDMIEMLKSRSGGVSDE